MSKEMSALHSNAHVHTSVFYMHGIFMAGWLHQASFPFSVFLEHVVKIMTYKVTCLYNVGDSDIVASTV